MFTKTCKYTNINKNSPIKFYGQKLSFNSLFKKNNNNIRKADSDREKV